MTSQFRNGVYPYSAAGVAMQKDAYSYSEFGGESFLGSYVEQRRGVLIKIQDEIGSRDLLGISNLDLVNLWLEVREHIKLDGLKVVLQLADKTRWPIKDRGGIERELVRVPLNTAVLLSCFLDGLPERYSEDTEIFLQLAEELVRAIEASKSVYTYYKRPFRNGTGEKNSHEVLVLSASFLGTLSCITPDLRFLNALLKLNDFLSSATCRACQVDLLLLRELCVVVELFLVAQVDPSMERMIRSSL